MNNFELKYYEKFCGESGISYARLRTALDKMFRDVELDIDEDDHGMKLVDKIQLTNCDTMGFLVAALIDYEDKFTVKVLSHLTDVVIVGDKNCPECGSADLEHDETLSVNPILTRAIVQCSNCGYSTMTTYETDEKY